MRFEAGSLCIEVGQNGCVTAMTIAGKNYLPEIEVPFIRIIKDQKEYLPDQMLEDGSTMVFKFATAQVNVVLEAKAHAQYMTFEVKQIEGDSINSVIWGPYPSTINEIVGEIIGVVQGDGVAFGLQSLNIKTLTGWPEQFVSQFDETGDANLSNISVCGYKYPEVAAAKTDFGSVVQAYCNDRTKDTYGLVWGKKNVFIKGFDEPDAYITGSKIALFGCKQEEALKHIGVIEEGEGLPHPMIDGEWGKTSRKAMMSYLITEFTDESVDEVLEVAQRGGFEYIYHGEPFSQWGHFNLRKECFKEGDASLKACVEKAQAKGIGVGLHTLTTFTTTNDPYVTPVPDQRLAKVQTTVLLQAIDEVQDTIAIADGLHFEQVDDLGAVLVGDELIQYEYTDEEDGQFCLMGCTRGAFGTVAAAHQQDEPIHKLWDHGYKVLFPDLQMQDEYIARLVALYNETGVKQISFDGLEGCLATGQGEYSVYRMVNGCYQGWDHEVINDSSRLNHHLWHIHTRTNWGEPWGATMREGQIDLRLMNQHFYHRNLFPRMLGWFLIRLQARQFEATTPDDIEWMLSKAAGFDAGFSVCMNENVMRNHGYTMRYMDMIKEWERARRLDAFTEEQKKKMLVQHSEWHLEKVDEDQWMLQEVNLSKPYMCDPEQLQPGQPGGADWGYTNPYDEQTLQIRLRAISDEKDCEGTIDNPGFVVDGKRYKFKGSIQAGQYLVYEGGLEASICDANFNQLQTAKLMSKSEIIVPKGTQALSFTAEFNGTSRPAAEVKFIVKGTGESVVPNH